MFILKREDGSGVSNVGDPADPQYAPLVFNLDSTPTTPDPTPPVLCLLSLPPGNSSIRGAGGTTGGAVIEFQGSSAHFWEMTGPDSNNLTLPDNNGWTNTLRVDVLGDGTPTRFWVRASTEGGEDPVDDRSVGLRVFGQVKSV